MKKIVLTLLIFFAGFLLNAQTNLDSLTGLLSTAEEDTTRIQLLIQIGRGLGKKSPIKAIGALEDAIVLIDSSDKLEDTLRFKLGMSAMTPLAAAYSSVGEKQKSVDLLLEILKIAEQLGDTGSERSGLMNLGVEFQIQGMYEEAMEYYRRALRIAELSDNRYGRAMALGNIGTCMGSIDPDSTLHYYLRSLAIMDHPDMNDREGAMGWMMNNIGSWFENKGQIDSAFYYYHKSEAMRESIDHRPGLCLIYRDLGELYEKAGNRRKAIDYFNKSIRIGEENELIAYIYNSYLKRSSLKSKLKDSAVLFFLLIIKVNLIVIV